MYNNSENYNDTTRGIASKNNYGNYGNGSDGKYYGGREVGNYGLGTNEYYEYEHLDDYNSNNYNSGYQEAGKIIPPLLIVFGTFGSVLIVLVFTRSSVYKNNKSTTKTFMCALAVSDLTGLYVGLFVVWLGRVNVIPATLAQSNLFLSMYEWITAIILQFSSWILLAVTIERVLAICHVFIVKKVCTQRLAKVYLIACGITFLVINSPCVFSYTTIYSKICRWVFSTFYCLIPFTVISVGNVIILFKIKHSHHRLMKQSAAPLEETGTKIHETCTRGRAKATTWSWKLLLINTVFIMSTFPYAIFSINETISEYDTPIKISLIDISMDMVFLNNTFNICLYCLSGAKFRQGLVELFPTFNRCHKGNAPGSLFIDRQFDGDNNTKEQNISSKRCTNVIPKIENRGVSDGIVLKVTQEGICDTVL